jgi:hypothetical protein
MISLISAAFSSIAPSSLEVLTNGPSINDDGARSPVEIHLLLSFLAKIFCHLDLLREGIAHLS